MAKGKRPNMSKRQLDTYTSRFFWAKVNKTGTCWLWTAAVTRQGYGAFGVKGKTHAVHKLSYEMHVGPVPKGWVVNHKCHVRNCLNPEHLEAVEWSDNLAYRKGAASHNKGTGVRGVVKTGKDRFRGRVRRYGVLHTTDIYSSVEETEEAVIALRKQIFGFSDFNPDDYRNGKVKA